MRGTQLAAGGSLWTKMNEAEEAIEGRGEESRRLLVETADGRRAVPGSLAEASTQCHGAERECGKQGGE